MAYTLLNAVNKVLKEARIIQGSTGELASLTDTAIQTNIDNVVTAWNHVMGEIYRVGKLRGEMAEGSFTLSTTGTDSGREYAVASDFVAMAENPKDKTNNRILTPYPGGFTKMWEDLLDPDDFQGKPSHWVIEPVNGNIRIDRTPTTDENGDVYDYVYEKARHLSTAAATFPFNDDAVDELVPAVVQVYRMRQNGIAQFIEADYQSSLARGMRQITGKLPRTSYGQRFVPTRASWPI